MKDKKNNDEIEEKKERWELTDEEIDNLYDKKIDHEALTMNEVLFLLNMSLFDLMDEEDDQKAGKKRKAKWDRESAMGGIEMLINTLDKFGVKNE